MTTDQTYQQCVDTFHENRNKNRSTILILTIISIIAALTGIGAFFTVILAIYIGIMVKKVGTFAIFLIIPYIALIIGVILLYVFPSDATAILAIILVGLGGLFGLIFSVLIWIFGIQLSSSDPNADLKRFEEWKCNPK